MSPTVFLNRWALCELLLSRLKKNRMKLSLAVSVNVIGGPLRNLGRRPENSSLPDFAGSLGEDINKFIIGPHAKVSNAEARLLEVEVEVQDALGKDAFET